MKKAKYFTVLGCVSLMAFAQNDFESNMITNENTLEKMTFKNELFIKPNSINNDTINRTKVHYSFSIGPLYLQIMQNSLELNPHLEGLLDLNTSR